LHAVRRIAAKDRRLGAPAGSHQGERLFNLRAIVGVDQIQAARPVGNSSGGVETEQREHLLRPVALAAADGERPVAQARVGLGAFETVERRLQFGTRRLLVFQHAQQHFTCALGRRQQAIGLGTRRLQRGRARGQFAARAFGVPIAAAQRNGQFADAQKGGDQ
jgi:hypothetical protein